jgi:hypothetical protein
MSVKHEVDNSAGVVCVEHLAEEVLANVTRRAIGLILSMLEPISQLVAAF